MLAVVILISNIADWHSEGKIFRDFKPFNNCDKVKDPGKDFGSNGCQIRNVESCILESDAIS